MTDSLRMRFEALAVAWRQGLATYRSELDSKRYWRARIAAERTCLHNWCVDGKVSYHGAGPPMDLYRCPKCGAFEWRSR